MLYYTMKKYVVALLQAEGEWSFAETIGFPKRSRNQTPADADSDLLHPAANPGRDRVLADDAEIRQYVHNADPYAAAGGFRSAGLPPLGAEALLLSHRGRFAGADRDARRCQPARRLHRARHGSGESDPHLPHAHDGALLHYFPAQGRRQSLPRHEDGHAHQYFDYRAGGAAERDHRHRPGDLSP